MAVGICGAGVEAVRLAAKNHILKTSNTTPPTAGSSRDAGERLPQRQLLCNASLEIDLYQEILRILFVKPPCETTSYNHFYKSPLYIRYRISLFPPFGIKYKPLVIRLQSFPVLVDTETALNIIPLSLGITLFQQVRPFLVIRQ
jgi:hypothetical protein